MIEPQDAQEQQTRNAVVLNPQEVREGRHPHHQGGSNDAGEGLGSALEEGEQGNEQEANSHRAQATSDQFGLLETGKGEEKPGPGDRNRRMHHPSCLSGWSGLREIDCTVPVIEVTERTVGRTPYLDCSRTDQVPSKIGDSLIDVDDARTQELG